MSKLKVFKICLGINISTTVLIFKYLMDEI